jgi:thioredoxin reductase
MMGSNVPVVDVAIVGGSYAGLSAAIYLGRGRRSVRIFDDGLTRNRFAPFAHSLLGQDGVPPEVIRQAGLHDALAYPTVELVAARVTAIRGQEGEFHLTGPGHLPVKARRVILAYGMRDVLPAIPGLWDVWGKTAFQCPYCHGYEVADRPTGLLMAGEGAVEHALFLLEWTNDLTLFTNGAPVSVEDEQRLLRRGVKIEQRQVISVESDGSFIQAIRLDDGQRVTREVLYVVSRQEPASDLAAQFGCAMADGPMGAFVQVNDMKQTSVPGVFAAGDLARPVFGLPFAIADGATAGVACHRALCVSDLPLGG